MTIFYALISIAVLTAVAVLITIFTRAKICALCAGVSLTWVWLLVARWLGYFIDPVVLGMLMGGSVVGSMYKIDKRAASGTSIIWKLSFVLFGFSLVYSVLMSQFIIAGLLAVAEFFALGLGLGWFASKNASQNERRSNLLEKMKNCCS